MVFNLSSKQKRIALKTFKGHKKAERIIAKERLYNLYHLNKKDGIARFNEIYRFHEEMPSTGKNKLSEQLHINQQCALRKRLNILAGSKVNE